MTKKERAESRRDFIAKLAGSLALLSTASALRAESAGDTGSVLAALDLKENPKLLQVGGFILIKKTSAGDLLIVCSGENQYSAFSTVCPHLQCNIKVKSSTLIQCPCHQSAYTIEGNYINGPAKKGLTKFPVSIEGGVVKVLKP
jgi:Rieske Fe-S protein